MPFGRSRNFSRLIAKEIIIKKKIEEKFLMKIYLILSYLHCEPQILSHN